MGDRSLPSLAAPKLTGNRCLCRSCGLMFSTVRNFDQHRRGGECRHPETAGQVEVAGIWKRAVISTPAAMARIKRPAVAP
jgi:hypothetical protein